MKALLDSTVLIHLNHHTLKMQEIINLNGITKIFISRINYIELLAGASINAKTSTRKFLQQFEVLAFGKEAANIATIFQCATGLVQNKAKTF